MTSETGVTGETVHTVRLRQPDGTTFVSRDALGNVNDGVATLVFKEELHRIHSPMPPSLRATIKDCPYMDRDFS
ncbi:hypothetical protein PN36_33690 [Candidatus Thiomargarita nelsonii]|uniref:Uncharacterized protein n=1 Tax=Candidatus Thiomargarita nelsonii TaxID=1003181 RepID=A0A0A6P9A0_9GAMM|nr:hypothetical protein PN36_33690 [Candidatus Thiomargarita nelsonii]